MTGMARLDDKTRIRRILSDRKGSRIIELRLNWASQMTVMKPFVRLLSMKALLRNTFARVGGLRLTRAGERQSGSEEEATSTVEKESGLYEPFAKFLEVQADSDGVQAIICSTHQLKARGKWSNPDVTRIAIECYRHLRKIDVTVTTYEVKQFPNWTVAAVYEAASHHRFAHEAYVVLEWPNGVEFSLTDPTYKLNQIARECRRHHVGLATLHPWYKSYRLRIRIEPDPKAPEDEDVELWMDYVLSRNAAARKSYDNKFALIQGQLGSGKVRTP